MNDEEQDIGSDPVEDEAPQDTTNLGQQEDTDQDAAATDTEQNVNKLEDDTAYGPNENANEGNEEQTVDETTEPLKEYTAPTDTQEQNPAPQKKETGSDARVKEYNGMDKEEIKNLLRRLSKSETSESFGNGSESSSSFEDSKGNKKSIKTLQSSVIRDHDLPMKIAYEQLEELAANAEKVKFAIEKNRNLLNVQVKKSNSRYLRAAFTAWKLQLAWRKTKKRDLDWANRRWKRNLSFKAFRTWSKDYLVTSKVRRLEKSVKNILGRHLLRQTWKGWRSFTRKRLQDESDRRRERRLVKDLDQKHQDKICRRACNFMYRWRLRRLFLGFRDGCEVSRMLYLRQLGIHKLLQKWKLKRLLLEWRSTVSRLKSSRSCLQKRQRKSLESSFNAWKTSRSTECGDMMGVDSLTDPFYQKCAKIVVAIAVAAIQGAFFRTKQETEYTKRISETARKQLLARAFDGFVDGCYVSRRLGNRSKRVSVRMDTWRLKKYFDAWICFMQIQAQKKMIRLQEHVVQVEKENDRARQENQRLTHVIDSGDWGRKRVAELTQAGQILSGERDALTRLLGRMQRQHSFALNQQKLHEEEIKELKIQLLKNNHRSRNKLLVKGASSFNSLVKAMKDDVLKNGTDPELLYTIDKLAMDEVVVYPDGDLRVMSVPNFQKGKGTWAPGRVGSPNAQNTQPTAQATTERSYRGLTPRKRRPSPKTPLHMSRSLPEESSTPPTPPQNRSRTPMKGRAFGRFDYTKRIQSPGPEPPPRLVTGDRNVLVKGAGYSRESSPRTNPDVQRG